MRFIGSVIEKLQRHPKRIVFPEGNEPRVLPHVLRAVARCTGRDPVELAAAATRNTETLFGL